MKVTIGATKGMPYPNFPRERKYTLKLVDTFPIYHSEIILNGDRLDWEERRAEIRTDFFLCLF